LFEATFFFNASTFFSVRPNFTLSMLPGEHIPDKLAVSSATATSVN
jgi:hypothetical protein